MEEAVAIVGHQEMGDIEAEGLWELKWIRSSNDEDDRQQSVMFLCVQAVHLVAVWFRVWAKTTLLIVVRTVVRLAIIYFLVLVVV